MASFRLGPWTRTAFDSSLCVQWKAMFSPMDIFCLFVCYSVFEQSIDCTIHRMEGCPQFNNVTWKNTSCFFESWTLTTSFDGHVTLYQNVKKWSIFTLFMPLFRASQLPPRVTLPDWQVPDCSISSSLESFPEYWLSSPFFSSSDHFILIWQSKAICTVLYLKGLSNFF